MKLKFRESRTLFYVFVSFDYLIEYLKKKKKLFTQVTGHPLPQPENLVKFHLLH